MVAMKTFLAAATFSTLAAMASAHDSDGGSAPPLVVKMGSRVISWDDIQSRIKPTKTGQRRDVFDAPTPTLDKFHCHVTTLNPGENTGPLHRHPQEEIVIVKEGTLEI